MDKPGLKRLAALFWLAGGGGLALKAASLLAAADALRPGDWGPWWAAATGVAVGLVKARYLFTPSCRRNLERIDTLHNQGSWLFFRKEFFFFLAAMIVAGATLSRLAQDSYGGLLAVAALDTSLSIALVISARVFFTPPHRIV